MTEQTVAVGDRVHPSTRGPPAQPNRSDVWYQWQTRPTGTVHTVARYHATNAPAGDGTDVGGTDHPISWCRDIQNGRSFYTGMGRTAGSYGEESFHEAPAAARSSGPPASCAAAARRRSTATTSPSAS